MRERIIANEQIQENNDVILESPDVIRGDSRIRWDPGRTSLARMTKNYEGSESVKIGLKSAKISI